MSSLLAPLPERGWGTLRAPAALVYAYVLAGLLKAQTTPTKDVFHARLTGAGRTFRAAVIGS